MRFLLTTTFASLLMLLAGCATPTTVDYERAAVPKMMSYRCFVIDSRAERSNYQDFQLTPVVDRRIESTLAKTLKAKGYESDCEAPDFRVTFSTLTQTKKEVTGSGMGPSPFRRYPYYGYNSQFDIREYKEGTFIIDVIDNSSKELVWRGAFVKRLGWRAPDDAEVLKIVTEVLAEFPPEAPASAD